MRAPVTEKVAAFIAGLTPSAVPEEVMGYARTLAFDGIGVIAAATHPAVTSGAGMAAFARRHGGEGVATLIGQDTKVDVVNAVFANGTLGYAADFEPHHPEAILHPIAIMVPTALALAETRGRTGAEALTAILLGCEITYRVSMALDPRFLYDLGFHPSAVAGTFGAAATAANLMGLDTEATVRTLGLAALQTSGLMAWQDDPREDARPFQMGMAARGGVTAALLAEGGFGAPDRIFDGGHTVLKAFGRSGASGPLVADLGTVWDGVMELAVKPYASVSFLHPALDALEALLEEHKLAPADIAAIDLRFANAGAHCVDDNPLKSHSAQYILPVRAALGRLSPLDLFIDRRTTSPEVARLAASATVTRDTGEFDARFPDFYVGEVTLTLADGRTVSATRDVARGYPEAPLSAAEITDKFNAVTGLVAGPDRRARLAEAARGLGDSPSVAPLMELLALPPEHAATADA